MRTGGLDGPLRGCWPVGEQLAHSTPEMAGCQGKQAEGLVGASKKPAVRRPSSSGAGVRYACCMPVTEDRVTAAINADKASCAELTTCSLSASSRLREDTTGSVEALAAEVAVPCG